MPRAVVEVHEPADMRRVLLVEREARVPMAENRERLVADPHVETTSLLPVRLARKLKTGPDLPGQVFGHGSLQPLRKRMRPIHIWSRFVCGYVEETPTFQGHAGDL
jgi:hypothetical protein